MYTIQSFIKAGAKASLMIAHPGHELRVHGWLELVRPRVFVLTDGSGHTGRSRLDATSAIVRRVGASEGSIYGALTDMDLYAAVLRKEHDRFIRLVGQLAEVLTDPAVDYVVGDAAEGYNPGHDVCRLLINAAVALANQNRHVALGNFACKLSGSPVPPSSAPAEDLLRLDDAALARKIAAGRGYEELAGEVEGALQAFGQDVFRNEYLPPVESAPWGHLTENGKPFYEVYGEGQVAAGHYREVLRYEEHMRPLMAALRGEGVSAVRENMCAS